MKQNSKDVVSEVAAKLHKIYCKHIAKNNCTSVVFDWLLSCLNLVCVKPAPVHGFCHDLHSPLCLYDGPVKVWVSVFFKLWIFRGKCSNFGQLINIFCFCRFNVFIIVEMTMNNLYFNPNVDEPTCVSKLHKNKYFQLL